MTLIPGLALTDHVFTVPLDHADPAGPTIEVYARSAVDPARRDEDLPWLVYLQGGPGGKSPRPPRAEDWLRRAVRTHRVLLLDQRGTGRSTPVTARVARHLGAGLADYLRHFRADAIVADCEHLRRELCGDRPWETLGQSYGGFVTLTYLSTAPHGLAACYVTGGLPGLTATAEDVYRRTYPLVRDRVDAYYERYPADAKGVREIAEHLMSRDVRLPTGDRFSVGRLQLLGLPFGMGDGLERVHYALEEAWDGGELSETFLAYVQAVTGFVDRPLYLALQETIYPRGPGWAAERVLLDHPEFAPDADPLLFTGEMAYRWMFDEIAALRPFAAAVEELAGTEWPPLWDVDALRANRVPVAAMIYHDDLYVPADLSLVTARAVGNCRARVTNEWEHDGITASGERVLDELMTLAAGR